MCGIAGAVNWGGAADLENMNRVQVHRGPDDGGTWRGRTPGGEEVGLANRRLAIQDLTPAGHMPMPNEDESIWITYNGEIYNFPDLRKELISKGHVFRSGTDTEVALHLYEEEGPGFVGRLEGMFAIAIWDAREGSLYLARDPFGVKPLYYIHRGGSFAFASEIKALLQLPGVPREVDPEALNQYLTFLWVPDPKTILKDIYKIPAGYYAIYRRGEFRLEQYWDLDFHPADHRYELSEDELIDQIRERFREAVRSNLISDVPVGAFLSSGIDSGAIVATMSGLNSAAVNSYTISFPSRHTRGEVTLDDTRLAGRLAEKLGCRHNNIVVEPDVADLLPKIVWHMDEPIADGAPITAYLVCREAKPTSTVLLSGIGGDELFAGYRKYLGHYMAQGYRKIPPALRRGLIEPLLQALPAMRGTPVKGFVRLAKKMARSGSLPPEERFLMDSTYFTEGQKASLWSGEMKERLEGENPWRRHMGYYERVSGADFLNQMLYLDTKAFMASLNLTYNDKMSMASSVEVRVPFLNKGFAEFIARSVPPSLKLNGRKTKYIFKKAMEGILPEEILGAPKAGFAAPLDHWLAHDLAPMTDDLLSGDRIRRRGHFDPKFVQRLIGEHRSGRQDWSFQIWALLTFELWQQAFVDSPAAAAGVG